MNKQKKEDEASIKVRGGKREGAGRPHSENPKRLRSLKCRDKDWEKILKLAAKENLSVGDLFVKLVSDSE